MNDLLRFALCFVLTAFVCFLNAECAVYPVEEPELETWYFHKTDADDNKVVIIGPHSDKVDINVVVCKALYFEDDYDCSSPDLDEKSEYVGRYKILCKDGIFEQDNCHVEVYVTRKKIPDDGDDGGDDDDNDDDGNDDDNDDDHNDDGNNDRKQPKAGPSLIRLIFYLVAGQLLLLLIFVPLGICLSRRARK